MKYSEENNVHFVVISTDLGEKCFILAKELKKCFLHSSRFWIISHKKLNIKAINIELNWSEFIFNDFDSRLSKKKYSSS